jgi:Bacterial TniB protein
MGRIKHKRILLLMIKQNGCFASYTDKENTVMTDPPLDESLDVHKRLEHLQTWQTEWYHIDRLLEDQVSHLDGSKLLELQQASHIANVRRRMEMTLAKKPLSIPESVLLHLGVYRIRELMASQFASLTRQERLPWLNSFFFLMTTDLRQLDDKIAKVRSYRSLGQARNFLLGGESGMGKTTYLDWLIFNHQPVVEQERNRVPIIGIQAPVSNQTARPLLWRMLLECGQTYVKSDNEEILLDACLCSIFRSVALN